tara:strand:- start:11841 stop:12989 length:1149 start_codon:yes stop_codon:yes gene_type:complete
MKVKYFRPDIFEIDELGLDKEPPIITVGQILGAYMPVDRMGKFNPFNMMYEPIPSIHTFNKTFEDCCMDAAKELWKIGKPIELFWSGGIDSSGALIALLETKSENDVLNIRYTQESINEFPLMWEKMVKDRNDPLPDKEMLSETFFENHDIIKITGECGDQCFGSDALHKNLDRAAKDWETILTWSKEDLFGIWNGWSNGISVTDPTLPIITDNNYRKRKNSLAEILFEHVDLSPIEIINVFDLYWWMNFCFKWQDVDSRMIFTFTTASSCQSTLSFFNTEDFQKWSLTNHDIKHNGTWETYKQPAKEYINKYIKDETYRKNKTKEPSLIKILKNSIDEEYTYAHRKKRRTSPNRIKLVLEDGRFWRRNEKVPNEIYSNILI